MPVAFFRNLPSGQPGASGRNRLLQSLLLVGIVALVGWGFWANSERRFVEIALQGLVRDATGELTRAEKMDIAAHAHTLYKKYGIRVEVAVLAPPAKIASWDGKSVLFILAPADRAAELQLPPLLRRAMDADAMPRLDTLMRPYFEKGQWRQGIAPALSRLDKALAEVTR